jgi:tRNA threonylcarbamoyladenosine biosynthesis protein TsaE
LLLQGDLGAGKTTLVKGLAEGFGVARQDDVTSPTFTLVHEYRGPRANLYHIDVYRIETLRELDTLGIDDLRNGRSIIVVEWGAKFDRLLQDSNAVIEILRTGENERQIHIRGPVRT